MVNLDFFLETQPQAWAEVLDFSLTEVDLKKSFWWKIVMVRFSSYSLLLDFITILRFSGVRRPATVAPR